MQRKLSTIIILGLLAIALALGYDRGLSRWHLFKAFQLQLIDSLYRYRSQHSAVSPTLDKIVIVGVDDESYRILNRRWPWNRDVFAAFFENLQQLNPKVIGLDFTLIGSSPDHDADQRLARAIALHPNTILAGYFDDQENLIQPLNRFRQAALGQGFIDRNLDIDAVNRRLTLVKPLKDGNVVYSLALAGAAAFVDRYPEKEENSVIELIPESLGQNAWASQRYAPKTFPYISFWKFVANQVKPEEIEGKIVLVGAVDPIFHDIHITSLGPAAGIYMNANDLASILDGDFIREILTDYRWTYFFVLSAIFIILIFRLNAATQLLIFMGAEAGVYFSALFLFSRMNILLEPFSFLFVLAVSYAMVVFYKVSRTFFENLALQHQVITDELTGLYGHRYLVLKLEKEFKDSADHRQEFCVAMLDADNFKRINDTYGHDQGNKVLVEISQIMKQHIRRNDIAARFGGEEFALIFREAPVKGAFECVERMRKAIAALRFSHPKGQFSVTISGGIASNRHPAAHNSEDLLKLADAELYRAKNDGRNCVCAAGS